MASMLKLKALLTKILQVLTKPTVTTSFTSKSASSGTWTTLDSVTIPANSTYMVGATVSCGAVSGTFADGYYSARTAVTSGTATLSYNGQQKAHTGGGGGASMCGLYKTGNSAITVSAQIYMHGTNTTSAAYGTLFAVPVLGGVS